MFFEGKPMRFTSKVLVLPLVLALLGCNSTVEEKPAVYSNKYNLYLDNAFPNSLSANIETEEEIFALSDEMKEMVKTKLLTQKDHRKRANKLLKQLFLTNQIDISYNSQANLIAKDAYNSKQANCMSLTILAYALAKEAGLNVKFQDVQIPEYWVRNGQFNMLTGHVNLLLQRPVEDNRIVLLDRNILEIDFDPYVAKKRFPKREISKATVVSMFYNNKGAQAMVKGDYDLAYAYFKAATIKAPSFSASWGNLAILYRFTENFDVSIDAYRHAIAIDDENLTALSNFAVLLSKLGEEAMALEITNRIYEKRKHNPYFYALLADEELHKGNFESAISFYKKAIRLDQSEHEFYFGLARAYYLNNNSRSAEFALRKAITLNKVKSIDDRYIAKLAVLKQTT